MAPVGPTAPAWRWAFTTTAVLFALRWHLAGAVGFGDAEALYACYALHPQPAYLDHPGLVGAIARFLGGGAPLSPVTAHRFTALVATALPWLGVVAARGAGASSAGALRTFFALALLPELAIGLFGLTPDLPLAVTWVAALGCAGAAVRHAPGSRAALAGAVGAGLFAGLAVLSKASGVLLLAGLACAFTSRPARAHLRTAGPWCGLGVALVLAAPVVAWERQEGWPLLAHRFVATQARAGFSFRNAGALIGGQLLYVTPPFLLGGFRVVQGLRARADAVSRLLWLATWVPAIPLGLLCLWSRVAEPHWLAPAYLGLALAAADAPAGGFSPRLARACVATGLAAATLAWAWVATPLGPRLSGERYVPRYDLSNDLYAWRSALPVIAGEVEAARDQSRDPVVVGPHWVVCAQAHAGLGPDVPVGCRTPEGDDFSRWFPERKWAKAPTVLFVTDDRFPVNPAAAFPNRDLTSTHSVRTYRGGRLVRTLRVVRLDRSAVAGTP